MYTMFILHKFYLFIYLMSANILVPSQSQIYVCKLWSEVSYLTRILLCLVAVRILIQGKYDL